MIGFYKLALKNLWMQTPPHRYALDKKEPSLKKKSFFAINVRKNQSRFDGREIRSDMFEILIDFTALTLHGRKDYIL